MTVDRSSVLRAQRGFTLVELMVVVAIIALLAAVIIPNYVHSRAEAAVSESEANEKQIATSLELYYNDNQNYPAKGDGYVDPTLFGGTGNPYLNGVPLNALGHAKYTYVPGTNQTTYTVEDTGPYDPNVLSTLPNGPAGAPCAAACTQIWYDPQNGLYGHA